MDRATLRFVVIAAVALAAMLPGAARPAPVALVTDVDGAATARGAPLKLLAELDAGSEIAVDNGARVVVFYLADGSEWTLAGRGRYVVAREAPRAQAGASAPQRKPAAPQLSGLRLRTDRATQGGVQMRGGSDRPALVAPVDDVVLDGSTVEFAWEPAGAGTVYKFELVDAAGTKVHVDDTRESALRLPAAVALVAGRDYVWAVSGRDPNLSQPFYRAGAFRVADAATRARLAAAKPAAAAPFSERVLYVAVLEQAGARGAAKAERAALSALRPAAWAAPR